LRERESIRTNLISLILLNKTQARALAREFVGGDIKLFHEITLRREDLTLDKVDNFFVFCGKEGDSLDDINRAKDNAVLQIWESLAESDMTGQTVIFVNTKQRARELAEFLRSKGYEVGQIHGDMVSLPPLPRHLANAHNVMWFF